MAEKLEHNAVESVTKNVRKGLLRASQRFTQRQRAELVTLLITISGRASHPSELKNRHILCHLSTEY